MIAFPADGYEARWATWDGGHADHVALRWENEAWTVMGTLARENVEYVVRLSPLWQVRQLLLFRDLDEPDLWLGTDGRGRWGEVNGAHRPDLDGAIDVHVADAAFSHALPIRRLGLPIDAAAELTVIEVDVDTLAALPRQIVYARLGERRWRVTRERATVEFDTDQYGLPHDIDGIAHRQ